MTLFSNGTEGEIWQDRWCEMCVNDHGPHVDDYSEGGCQIWAMALATNDPAEVPEFLPTGPEAMHYGVVTRWYCTGFEACHCPAGAEDDPEARVWLRGLTALADS